MTLHGLTYHITTFLSPSPPATIRKQGVWCGANGARCERTASQRTGTEERTEGNAGEPLPCRSVCKAGEREGAREREVEGGEREREKKVGEGKYLHFHPYCQLYSSHLVSVLPLFSRLSSPGRVRGRGEERYPHSPRRRRRPSSRRRCVPRVRPSGGVE